MAAPVPPCPPEVVEAGLAALVAGLRRQHPDCVIEVVRSAGGGVFTRAGAAGE